MSFQSPNYDLTTIDRIINTLSTWEYASYFTKFIYGDPGIIPKSDQPCIVIDLMRTKITQDMTGNDKVVEMIDLGVVINKDSYINTLNDDTVDWKKQLEQMVQGRNPTTNQYDATSLLGVLRINYTVGDYIIDQEIDIEYGQVPRNAASSEVDENVTGEAHLLFTVTHYQEVPTRT